MSTLYVRGLSFNDYLAGTASTLYVRGLSGHRHHPGSCSEAHWGRRETENIRQNMFGVSANNGALGKWKDNVDSTSINRYIYIYLVVYYKQTDVSFD